MDVRREMPRIFAKFGLKVAELVDYTTACTRKQDLEMGIWQVLLRLSPQLQETSKVQAHPSLTKPLPLVCVALASVSYSIGR